MMEENESAIAAALAQDLRKPNMESSVLEIGYIKNDVRGVLHNFEQWTEDEPATKNLVTLLDSTFIHSEPLGVVLIIGAWNYPIQLTLGPLAGAISAGNCVILKPSEMSPETALLIERLVSQYMDPDCIKVICADVARTTELLKEKFDHIFFTGAPKIGQIVREAANKHLTPVTLELGGKCPVFVDDCANLEVAVKRILWGKMVNLGQTCVAPDYVLCTKQMQDKIVEKARNILSDWYGDKSQESPDLCRIINRRHMSRLVDILQRTKGDIIGGKFDLDDLFIEPTLITNVSKGDASMEEELFGPLLPFVIVKDKEEAIELIRSGEKPLSLYVFSDKKEVVDAFIANTSSGSMAVNDVVVQLSIDTLPFGGVGKSGMGSYHGKYTFKTFSHAKSVLVRDLGFIGETLGMGRYPPYSDSNISRLNFLVKNRKMPRFLSWAPHLSLILVGVVSTLVGQALLDKYARNGTLSDWF